MSFEAYSVAVRLKLVDMVTPALGVIGAGIRRLHGDANAAQESVAALEKRLQSIKGMAIAGGAAMGAGIIGLSLFDAPLKAAREYELAFTKFKTLNLGDAVNKQADQFARSANLMGISAKDLMTTMSESVGIFGSYAEAQKLAPKIAQLNAANTAIFHGKIGSIDEGASRSLMKFIDRRGGTKDEASFMRNLDLAEKLVTGSGGFIKFSDLDQFSQHGGTAFRGLSDAGILNMAMLLQEQGGSRAGTSLMSLYQNLIAGRTPKKTMALLQDYGLGHLGYETHATVGGKALKSMVVKDIKGAELLQANPPEWFRTVFLPALAAKGVTSEADILKVSNDLLSNRTGSAQGSIMSTQLLQILRDSNLAKNAMGYDDTIKAYKDDPNSKFADLTAKWTDTLRELGLVVLPKAIEAVEGLTGILRGIVNFAHTAPELTKNILVLGATLSGLAAAGGALMLATAGFRALGLALVVGKGVTLAANLIQLAGALGKGGLAGATVLAVGAIGTLIYSLYELYNISNREGVKLTPQAQSALDDPDNQSRIRAMDDDFKPKKPGWLSASSAGGASGGPSPFMADHRARMQVNVINKIDKNGLTTMVLVEAGRRLNSGSQTGSSGFDSRLALWPAGGQ